MKYILSGLTLMTLPLVAGTFCPLCEINKAYNKDHPGDYEYYEDYLKATEGKEAPKKEESAQKAK